MVDPTERSRGRSVASASAIYLLSNVVAAAIPFALMPVLTRYMKPAEYGEVAIFQTLLGFLAAFVGLNAHGALARKYFDKNMRGPEYKHFIAACLQILFVSTFFMLALAHLLRAPLSAWLELAGHWQLWAVVVSAMTVVIHLRLAQWQVEGRAGRYALLQTSWSALNVALALGFVVLLSMGAAGRIGAQIAATGVTAVAALLLLAKYRLLAFFTWRPAYIKEALSFGVPLIPHALGIFLIAFLDRIVIGSELGLGAAGIYMVAAQLAGALGLLFDAMNKAYVPWLYERLTLNDLAENGRIVRYTYLSFAILLTGGCAAFVLGPFVIRWVAGEQYHAGAEVIGWLALGHCFSGMYLLVTNYVFYSQRTALLSVATMAAGILNVVLLVVLTRALGLKGAAIAFSASMALRFALTWWVASHQHPMPWLNPWQRRSSA